MFKQGPIPAFVHGVVEYLAAILFIAAPFIFDFDTDAAVALSLIVGVVVLIIAATTHWQTGLIQSIPVQAHVMLDYVLAIFLIASPFILGFSDDGTAAAFFIVHRRRASAAHDRHAVRARRAAAAEAARPPKKPA